MLNKEQIDNWNKTNQTMVEEFHDAMGQPKDAAWAKDTTLEELRSRLISEEFVEFMMGGTPDNILKELADILYVSYGYCVTYGWDLEEAFKRVHESNMSKLGDDGKPLFRPDGKVQKGPNYKKPNLEDLVK
jgi:predicted HAD superfamily Cof-like phosphohydrolase